MYQTLSFNIFEENLEEIVYGKKSVPQTENIELDKKTVVVIGQVTVPKIDYQNSNTLIYKRFERDREGTSNVR